MRYEVQLHVSPVMQATVEKNCHLADGRRDHLQKHVFVSLIHIDQSLQPAGGPWLVIGPSRFHSRTYEWNVSLLGLQSRLFVFNIEALVLKPIARSHSMYFTEQITA